MERSDGEAAATFVAEAGGVWAGLAGGFRAEDRVGTFELVSMWVAPERAPSRPRDPAGGRSGGVGVGCRRDCHRAMG